MTLRFRREAVLLILVLISGCGPAKHISVPRHKTSPVTGIVQVDGQPAAGVTVECHPMGDPAPIKHTVSALTDGEGKFSIGMYEAGDGLPQGTYNLTFLWQFGMVKNDKLNGAYLDPKKSKHTVTVDDGSNNDLGVIELSASGPPRK